MHSMFLYYSLALLPLAADSVLAFKQRMKLGRFTDEGKDSQGGEQEEERERQEKAEADAIPVGSRCEVTLQKSTPRRGTVMFVGE